MENRGDTGTPANDRTVSPQSKLAVEINTRLTEIHTIISYITKKGREPNKREKERLAQLRKDLYNLRRGLRVD